MTARFNFEIWRGTDADYVLALRDGRGPMDLTGFEADMQIRSAEDDTWLDSLKTSDERLVIEDGGRIRITFPRGITAEYTPGRFYWDLLIESPDGRLTRVIDGWICVHSGVRRV